MAHERIVLLADGDRELTADLAFRLTEAGYAVMITRTGGEALRLLQSTPVDVIVAAADLPGLTGLQLLETAQRAGLEQPFIVLAGGAQHAARLGALQLGCYDVLDKPLDATAFMRAVGAAMDLSVTQQAMRHHVAPTAA
jgi:DNA-binding response OmpR family regulator